MRTIKIRGEKYSEIPAAIYFILKKGLEEGKVLDTEIVVDHDNEVPAEKLTPHLITISGEAGTGVRFVANAVQDVLNKSWLCAHKKAILIDVIDGETAPEKYAGVVIVTQQLKNNG